MSISMIFLAGDLHVLSHSSCAQLPSSNLSTPRPICIPTCRAKAWMAPLLGGISLTEWFAPVGTLLGCESAEACHFSAVVAKCRMEILP